MSTSLSVGTLAGCLTQLVVTPLSVVQTRIITRPTTTTSAVAGAAGAAAPPAPGIIATFFSILRHEGWGGLYSGLLPSLILATNPALQNLVFDRLRYAVGVQWRVSERARRLRALRAAAAASDTARLAPSAVAAVEAEVAALTPPPLTAAQSFVIGAM
jgi:hypothetical protein